LGSEKMNLLAIDTATSVLSVALSAGEDIWVFEADAGRRHSELVMDSIDLLMKKAGLAPADLSGLACMGGPGSFTGLRIGFSIVKGLSLSLGIPFDPVPSLDCIASPFAAWPGPVVPVIEATKHSFFCAVYRDGRLLAPPMDTQPDHIVRTITACGASAGERGNIALLSGPGADQLYRRISPEFTGTTPPKAVSISQSNGGYARPLLALYKARIAQNPEISNNRDENCFSGPDYIRKSDAELNAK
jgi:tRNA threonylcarbamoyladenosine biosynthesis protein TsaB